jgi:tetratricopeptide (TPR) repeat protein
MKDPLFADESGHPYELLGIGPRATLDEINLAYRRGFAKPNRLQLRAAQSVLLDPQQRILVDLFDLDDDALRRLIGAEPSSSCLVGPERRTISQRWWTIQKESFPDFQASHGLAVVFYWWAISEEESFFQLASTAQGRPGLESATSKAEVNRILGKTTGPGETASSRNPIDELWKWTLAHWAQLLDSEQFWEQWVADHRLVYGDVNGAFTDATRAALSAKIESRLRHLADRNQALGTTSRANHLRQYELALMNERSVGRQLVRLNAGIFTNAGPVACGHLMLGLLGAVDTVRERIARRLTGEKENLELQTLWLQLSQYAHILVLLDRKDWKGALNALAQFSEKERNSPEAAELRARALNEEGNYHALQDDTSSSFDRWKRALRETRFEGLKKSIQDALVTYCKKRVASLQESDLPKAFKLVEDARTIVRDTSLDKTLSHLYVLRSNQRYQSVASPAKTGGPSKNIEKELRNCIDDLKKAVSLDPQNKQTSEQLRLRENEVKLMFASLEELTSEIDGLESKPEMTIAEQHMLAELLNARAIVRVKGTSKEVEKAKEEAGREIRTLFRWRWMPRIPLYLLGPLIAGLGSIAKNNDHDAIWALTAWAIFFLVCLVARNWWRSANSTPNYRLPQQFLCCGICLRMGNRYNGVPGYGSVNLCDKHLEQVNSISEKHVKTTLSHVAFSAAQDAYNAIDLWPEFQGAKETLEAIKEMDPNAADLAFWGRERRNANVGGNY